MQYKRSDAALDWPKRPKGTWIPTELIRSDAWRVLTATEKEIWLFTLTRRIYPKGKKRDYWSPRNKKQLKVPTIAIQDFFNGPAWGMTEAAPHQDTIRRAFRRFMEVGLLSLAYQGGNGKGDQNIYCLEYAWRTWRKGDPPCFEKMPMVKGKGFCQPGSSSFYRSSSN